MSDQAARSSCPKGSWSTRAPANASSDSSRRRPRRGPASARRSSPLAPGASYRVHAEWSALETPAMLARRRADRCAGAVLVRPGVAFEVRDGQVEVGGGSARDRPGRAHPRSAPPDRRARDRVGTRTAAVSAAAGRRVPGACRVRSTTDLVRLVNRLVRRDVEARIAAPDVAAGLHLTRPCLAPKRRRSAPWPPTWW